MKIININKFLKNRYKDNFSDSELSTEAYIGRTVFIDNLTNCVSRIRMNLDSYINKKDKHSIDVIESLLKELGVLISDSVNVESCKIILEQDINFYTYPMSISKNMFYKDNKDNIKINKDFQRNLADAIFDKNTYKFRDPKDKFIVIGFGIKAFTLLEDEEIVAILIHEIGHNFQEMFFTIEESVYSDMLVRKLKTLGEDIMRVIGGVNVFYKIDSNHSKYIRSKKDIFKSILVNNKINRTVEIFDDDMNKVSFESFDLDKFIGLEEQKGNKIASQKLLNLYNKYGGGDFSHKEIISQLDNVDKIELKKTIDSEIDIEPEVKKSFLNKMVSLFRYILGSIVLLLISPIELTTTLYTILIHLSKKRHTKYNNFRQAETIADSMVVIYGLGPQLISGLSKIDTSMSKAKNDLFNDLHINKIPIVNICAGMSMLRSLMIEQITNPRYFGGYSRSRFIINMLKAELKKNNTTLSDKQKSEILLQINDSEETLNMIYTDDKEINFFFRFVMKYVLHRSRTEKGPKSVTNLNMEEATDTLINIYDETLLKK